MYNTDYGCVHIKDPMESVENMGLSTGSGILSVADMSIIHLIVMKGDVKFNSTNQPTWIY